MRNTDQRNATKSKQKFEVLGAKQLPMEVPLPLVEVWEELQPQVEHLAGLAGLQIPSDSPHRRFQQLRCIHCRSDFYRVERISSRAGLSPAVSQRPFTAHGEVRLGRPESGPARCIFAASWTQAFDRTKFPTIRASAPEQK
jgi:hypothetical protein